MVRRLKSDGFHITNGNTEHAWQQSSIYIRNLRVKQFVR